LAKRNRWFIILRAEMFNTQFSLLNPLRGSGN